MYVEKVMKICTGTLDVYNLDLIKRKSLETNKKALKPHDDILGY